MQIELTRSTTIQELKMYCAIKEVTEEYLSKCGIKTLGELLATGVNFLEGIDKQTGNYEISDDLMCFLVKSGLDKWDINFDQKPRGPRREGGVVVNKDGSVEKTTWPSIGCIDIPDDKKVEL